MHEASGPATDGAVAHASDLLPTPPVPALGVGDQVELRVGFTDGWSEGFEVAELIEGGYHVRRRSDGGLLPAPTGPEDLRRSESAGSGHWAASMQP